MNFAHLLEATMLVCFGFSWPLNVVKAYKARTAKGTSLAFIILIITGYIAGISAKIINQQFNYVLAVYFLNLAIVMTNIFVYIRNVALDKQAAKQKEIKVRKIDIKEISENEEENMMNYSNSLDDLINKSSSYENTNGVILLGGSLDKKIPVTELAGEFDFNFDIYNKSQENLSVEKAAEYFNKEISNLYPEGILVHLGEEDLEFLKKDAQSFDNCYFNLIDEIRACNKSCRIALVSVSNPEGNKDLSLLNAHIKAIAETENIVYINLENAKLWNPKATKAASDFAYCMGLKVRKPLKDVAEILYSYAYQNLVSVKQESLVG